MLKRILQFSFLISLILFVENSLCAGPVKKQVEAVRAGNAPIIDGDLSDIAWKNALSAGQFLQVSPFNGQPSRMKTEVRFVYNDEAIYVGAFLHDPSPDSIVKYLSKRDDLSLADKFGIYFDPFNDGLIAYGFFVTAAGVQGDMRSISGNRDIEDETWDAVWESAVDINDEGWVVEMKIPYSALRFPKENGKKWGMNIFRSIRRYREESTWNYVNQEENSVNGQAGMLAGVINIEPPMRLAFNPYAASYINKYSNSESAGYSVKGGLDLKYGINESFTLDMMLIPDFGQVESDDEVLNLSPFETYYDEKRGFFMEGNELFERANIFYSRRIGSRPVDFYSAYENLNENEYVTENPAETQILNASKITGKTRKGLSAGFLNAMTNPMYAIIKDSITGEERKLRTQNLRNYNISVLEQSLRNNSYVSLINTNLSALNDPYSANVTGIDLKIANKENSHAIFLKSAYSNRKINGSEKENGYYHDLDISRIRGRFLWNYNQRLETDRYNPNDLGFVRASNEISNGFRLNYNIYQPFWKILRLYNSVFAEYSTLFKPRVYSDMHVGLRSTTTFVNYFTLSVTGYYKPDANDWYESRVDGRKIIEPGFLYGRAFISSDYRKKFAIDAEISCRESFEYESSFTGFSLSPRFRINDRFFVNYSLEDNIYNNQPGYIDHTEDQDSIYFGLRDMNTLVNTFNANYAFNNRASLSFRVRHYWSYLEYDDYFLLNEMGRLEPYDSYFASNRNFNAFNIDMVYSWFFAPGSEMTIVWKNSIEADEEFIINNYTDNFRSTLSSPQFNSISIKVLYYLDYQTLKKRIAG